MPGVLHRPMTPQAEVPCLNNASCGQSESVGWSTPCTNMTNVRTCRERFSAICWLYARAVYANLR